MCDNVMIQLHFDKIYLLTVCDTERTINTETQQRVFSPSLNTALESAKAALEADKIIQPTATTSTATTTTDVFLLQMWKTRSRDEIL